MLNQKSNIEITAFNLNSEGGCSKLLIKDLINNRITCYKVAEKNQKSFLQMIINKKPALPVKKILLSTNTTPYVRITHHNGTIQCFYCSWLDIDIQ